MSSIGRQPKGLWLCCLLLISHLLQFTWAITYLRTARVDSLHSRDDWLDQRAARQLLGLQDCRDERWGLLCGRTQLLVQRGRSPEQQRTLLDALHTDKAAICGYLPHDTWLVLARLDDLQSPVYNLHSLLPYAPEYKVAPEWHPVLELIHHQQQQLSGISPSDAALQHLQLHEHVLEHELVQQLQLHQSSAQQFALQQVAAVAAEQLMRIKPAKLVVGVHFPDVPQSELEHLGYGVNTFSPAAAAVADWQKPLGDLVAADGRCDYHIRLCQPELMARGTMQLDVAVCPQDLSEVLYWLSQQAAVHWLAPRARLLLQNSVASMIVQDNGMAPATVDYYTQPDAHPFWGAGLDGKDQIIGIGDSGIDMDSCFFKDSANPFSPPADGDTWTSPNHRKVVMYWGLADDKFRDLVGHGTHTSGSLAGINPSDPSNRATGSAKSARLAFTDLSRTASGDVNAPQDVAKDYYPKMYEAGARVFSDSWGSTAPVYDFQSSRVDAWLHDNQDTISHFAAGNYGENDNLDTTITSPATAKNVVTVGATKSLTQNYISQTIAPVFRINIKIMRNSKTPQYISVRLVKAEFGGDGASLSKQGLRMVRADPPSACGALIGDYKNAIVLARRGQCLFSDKMAAGSAAGAAAVVIINERPGGYFKMDAQAQDSQGAQAATIALFALPKRMGEELWALFDNANSITASIERYTETWEAYEDIAAFSSFGPATDGRIKPDIVCPGELVSASSSDSDPTNPTDTCNVGRKSGTSMATPMVAGHAAIVRQYFMDGFYPSGAATAADAHTPSGPLIKAVMMGGACDMKGNTEQYLPLEESPSNRQGFGRLCLCSSLKLAGKCDTSLQVVDRVPITSQDTHKYCLQTSGGDVRIMLVWYDPPAQLSAEITLVNNLDLTVKSAGMGGQVLYGNHGQTADTLNTAERVWLKNAPAGGLEITVTATINAASGASQNYSLVVQGSFKGVLASPYNPYKSAQGQPTGGCSAAQMMTVEQPATVPAQPQSVPAPTTLVAAAPVHTEAAAQPNTTAEAPPQPAPARVQIAQPAVAATVSPIVPEQQLSPSPSPGPPNSEALIGMLITALQSPPPAGSAQDVGAGPSPAAAPDGTLPVASPAVAPDVQQGRRLTWMPSPPAGFTVKVPNFMCQWLAASGVNRSTLETYTTAHPEGGRSMHIPMHAVLVACVLCALAAVAVLLYGAIRRHRLARCGSLTTAISANVSHNKCKARQEASEQLREALLRDPGLAAHLNAAGQEQLASQPSSSRSGSMSSSSSLEVNTSSGSGDEAGTPTSLGTAFAATPGIAPPDSLFSTEQQQVFMLPGARSCPVPAANMRMTQQLSLNDGVNIAAGGPPAAAGRRSLTVCDQHQAGPLAAAGSVEAAADQLDVLRKGTRSLHERPPQPFWWQAQQQHHAAGALSLQGSCDSVMVPLPQARSWDLQQQQQQQPPMQRARSFTSSVSFFKGRSKEQCPRPQHIDQTHHCHVVLPDAHLLRDQ